MHTAPLLTLHCVCGGGPNVANGCKLLEGWCQCVGMKLELLDEWMVALEFIGEHRHKVPLGDAGMALATSERLDVSDRTSLKSQRFVGGE